MEAPAVLQLFEELGRAGGNPAFCGNPFDASLLAVSTIDQGEAIGRS
jgi:hypothetical protein